MIIFGQTLRTAFRKNTAPLTKNTISEDSNEYGYALHVLNHESTVNASDIKEYILDILYLNPNIVVLILLIQTMKAIFI